MNKKIIISVSGVALAVIILGGVVLLSIKNGESDDGNKIYVESVGVITGDYGSLGIQNRFSGVVEPQETLEIKLDSSKKVKEIYVEEGQEIEAGTKLFSYDISEMELNIKQGEVELERIENEIQTTLNQIKALEEEKAGAVSDDKLSYTIQIQSLQNSVKRAEYNKNSKKLELEQLQKGIDEASVVSSIDGVVKSINKENSEAMGGEGQNVFMTILATGDYRVKATTNEQNIWSLSQGQRIIARSRINEENLWNGDIVSIDTENPEDMNKDNMDMAGKDGINQIPASKYNFYVNLDSYEGLIIGQHLYIEVDAGEIKEGLWLPASYITAEEEEAYLWVAGKKDRLERRKITLGEYDSDSDKYEILEGLSLEDHIAFPDENIKAGTKVIMSSEGVKE